MSMNSTRRKLAIATWNAPSEGNIFGKLEIDASQIPAYLRHVRETTGEKVSVTHLVGKAVALALRSAPGLNGYIRLGTYVRHETVDVTFLVMLESGADLAKAKIARTDEKSTAQLAGELRAHAEKLRGGKDPDFEKSKGVIKLLPTFLLRPLVWLTGFLGGALGMDIPPLGVQRFPFGSCMVTSVGMFGIDEAYAPFTPFARVPLLVAVGALRDVPAVQDGQLVARKALTLTATIDHRFVDGFQLATLAKIVRDGLENPWKLDGLQGPPAALLSGQALA